MNPFESTVVSALRDEAQEIAMSTNLNDGRAVLESSLDKVDAGRRRRIWLTGAVAAVAVIVAVAVGVARPTATQPPAGPSPTPSAKAGMAYTSASLRPSIALTLPYWTSTATAGGTDPGSVLFAESSCAKLGGEDPCPAEADLKLRLESVSAYFPVPASPTARRDPSYAQFLSHLDRLAAEGVVRASGRAEVSVGGRPATVMTLEVLRDAPGAVGCPDASAAAADCFPLVAGRTARLALVDQGAAAPPTLLYISMNVGALDEDERLAEFDGMLNTVSFG